MKAAFHESPVCTRVGMCLRIYVLLCFESQYCIDRHLNTNVVLSSHSTPGTTVHKYTVHDRHGIPEGSCE